MRSPLASQLELRSKTMCSEVKFLSGDETRSRRINFVRIMQEGPPGPKLKAGFVGSTVGNEASCLDTIGLLKSQGEKRRREQAEKELNDKLKRAQEETQQA